VDRELLTSQIIFLQPVCRCGTWPVRGLVDQGKVCMAAPVLPVIYFWTGLSSALVQSFPDWFWSWSILGKTDGPCLGLFSLYSATTHTHKHTHTTAPVPSPDLYCRFLCGWRQMRQRVKIGGIYRCSTPVIHTHTYTPTSQTFHPLVVTSCTSVNVLTLKTKRIKHLKLIKIKKYNSNINTMQYQAVWWAVFVFFIHTYIFSIVFFLSFFFHWRHFEEKIYCWTDWNLVLCWQQCLWVSRINHYNAGL